MGQKIGLLAALAHGARFVLNRTGFQSRSVPTAIGALHAYDAQGTGPLPTIVLLHGLGSAATSFAPLLTRMRPHVRRLVALDLPGHGFSQEPSQQLTPQALFGAVCEALDALVDEPMILVGGSLGGALALRYAVERPQRLVGLALLSPAAARTSASEWEVLRDAFKIESSSDARRLLGRLYHRPPWYLPAFAAGVRDVLKGNVVRDVIDTATLDDLPAARDLPRLAMPILLLWGQSERLLPPSSLAYFRQHLPPHAVIEEPAGFGHCPHLDDPTRLASRLLEFARTTSPRPTLQKWPATGATEST